MCLRSTFFGLMAVFVVGCANSSRALSPTEAWIERHGGLIDGVPQERAAAVARRVTPTVQETGLTVRVLAADSVVAYSWPNGEIYISRGLLETTTDDELAAAIAHEIGHLLDNGHLPMVRSLADPEASADAEARADLIGCRVLESSGFEPQAMIRMLEKVCAAQVSDADCRRRLSRRIDSLRMTIATPSQ